MFKKNRKKKEVSIFHTVAQGKLMPIDAVGDGVFSEKLLGDGYAVKPENGDVFAPIGGKVVSVFPTKHAITLETSAGLEVLIHMGIDTVALKGKPFEIFVSEGEEITFETKMATMDLAKLEETDTVSTIIVVITNMDKVAEISKVPTKSVSAREEACSVKIA